MAPTRVQVVRGGLTPWRSHARSRSDEQSVIASPERIGASVTTDLHRSASTSAISATDHILPDGVSDLGAITSSASGAPSRRNEKPLIGLLIPEVTTPCDERVASPRCTCSGEPDQAVGFQIDVGDLSIHVRSGCEDLYSVAYPVPEWQTDVQENSITSCLIASLTSPYDPRN